MEEKKKSVSKVRTCFAIALLSLLGIAVALMIVLFADMVGISAQLNSDSEGQLGAGIAAAVLLVLMVIVGGVGVLLSVIEFVLTVKPAIKLESRPKGFYVVCAAVSGVSVVVNIALFVISVLIV